MRLFMNINNITRPKVSSNYTVLPNEILNYGRHIEGLKPRDSAVLNYLLSRPPCWKLRAADIALAINVSINTVYTALATLRKLGFASYTRNKFGHTFWIISLHQTVCNPVTVPHTKIPREEFCNELINNETILNNKTTTVLTEKNVLQAEKLETTDLKATASSSSNNIKLDLKELSEDDNLQALKILNKSKLDNIAYTSVLMSLKLALNNGHVRCPIAYLQSLINRSKNGTLSTHTFAKTNNINNNNEKRVNIIKNVLNKHGDKVLQDLISNDAIQIKELGLVQYHEIKQLGLLTEFWINKYNEIQINRMIKLSETNNIDISLNKKFKIKNKAF